MPLMTSQQPPQTDPAPADRDWFGGRRWTGIAAVGVVIVVALCVVIVVLARRGGGSSPTTAAGGSSSSAGASSTAPSSDSSAPAVPTTVPSDSPSGTVWTIFDTVALPSIAGAGPAHVNGAVASGYAHTPLGALLATANDTYRVALAGAGQWRAALDATIAPGPGKDEAIVILSQQYASGTAPTDPGTRSQIAGFRFVSYSSDTAVIQLVTRDVRGVLQVSPQQVQWSGTDWLLVLPATPVTPQIAPSLAGFVQWGGV